MKYFSQDIRCLGLPLRPKCSVGRKNNKMNIHNESSNRRMNDNIKTEKEDMKKQR
jgi:hypothetical protein